MKKDKKHILTAITGASGMPYLASFLKQCAGIKDLVVHALCSDSGRKVLAMESGLDTSDLPGITRWFDVDDFTAPPASGSSRYDAMVILPCSMGTLATVSNGLTINLIHRSADVMLKEKKRVVMCVRETPLNRTHIQNMLKAHDAGAVIMPIMPGFYFNPSTIEETAQHFSWRILDQLGLDAPGRKRWGNS